MLADDMESVMDMYRVMRKQEPPARFAGVLRNHLERDYRNARGLVILGYSDCKTKPFVEADVDPQSGRTTFDMMVAVFHEQQWIVFDKKEALGYDEFVVSGDEYARRVECVKARSIEEKRSSDAIPDR